MAHWTSPLIAIELLSLIKQNGFFFELNPTTAIQSILCLFRSIQQLLLFDFDEPGTESSIFRILNCI